MRGNPVGRESGKELLVRTGQVGLGCQDVDDSRVEPIPDERQQLGPDPISWHAHIVVGRVVHGPDVAGIKKSPDVCARAVEQRPDDDAVAGMHCGEPAAARASDQT